MTLFNSPNLLLLMSMVAIAIAPLAPPLHANDVPAFPGAEGYGAQSAGGRGGRLRLKKEIPNEPGKQVHIILEVTDSRTPPLVLLYANEFDIEALIASSGTFANVARKQNILDVIDRYALVHENLKHHDSKYRAPDKLREVTFEGQSGTWGKKQIENIGEGKDSEASDALIAIVDKPDPRPVYVSIWGDCSVVAQAVWKVQRTRNSADLEKFPSKLRIHQIAVQDGTISWLREQFPQLFIIHSEKTYFGMFGSKDPLSDLAWINEHIRHNHNPLCDVYPHEGMGCTGFCEGDSPAFLWLVSANRGLNDPDDPTQPSWGGQFRQDGEKKHYIDGPGSKSISKWRAEYQKEFAERADWCVSK